MKVGSAVKCVYDFAAQAQRQCPGSIVPKVDKVYHVRAMLSLPGKKQKFLLLDEIVNKKHFTVHGVFEVMFDECGFREVEFPPNLEAAIKELLTEPVLIEA